MIFFILSFSEIQLFSEEEMVVSPFLFHQEVKEAPANITIFTKEDIEELGIRTLAELLMYIDGIYVVPSERHLHRVWVRGIKGYYNDRILLLIDGVPQREPIYGHAPVDENLPLDMIERIEIMKGPLSSLYGSNAFAAVVNIITRSPEKETKVSLSIGSFNTIEGWVRSSGDVFLGEARIYNSEGDGPKFSQNGERNAFQLDPVHAENFIGKFEYNGVILFMGFDRFRHKYTALRDIPYEPWVVDWFFYNTLRISFLLEKEWRWIKGGVRIYREEYDNGGYYEIPYNETTYSIFPIKKTSVNGVNGFLSLERDRWGFIAGGSFENLNAIDVRDLYINKEDPEDTVSPFADTSLSIYDYWMEQKEINTWGVFTEARIGFGWLSFMGGVRGDVFREEINIVPRCILKIGKKDLFSLKFMYGEAYRNPSARELYMKSTGRWPKGNEELRNEKIITREALLYFYPLRNTLLKMSIFGNTIKDLIEVEDTMYVNSDKEDTIIGGELALKRIGDNYRLSMSISHIFKQDEFYPSTMLKFILNFRPTYTLSISPIVMWVGKRGDQPSYVDLSLSVYKLRGPFRVNFKVLNLLNIRVFEPNYRRPEKEPLERGERKFILSVSYAI